MTIIFSHPEVILCKLPKLMLDDAQVLSKWGAQTVDANPDMAKARRRVKSLDPQWRFCFSTAVEFDIPTDISPYTERESDLFIDTDMFESNRFMQRDTRGVR